MDPTYTPSKKLYDITTQRPFTYSVREWELIIEALKFKMPDRRAYDLAVFLNMLLRKKQEKTPKVRSITMKVTRRQAMLVRRAVRLASENPS